MGDFCMPSLGADMDSGRVTEWHVAPGDEVHRGDIVAVVQTDKSDIEVEVFEDGVVDELLVDLGQEVPVGTPLARISAPVGPGTAAPEVASPEPPAVEPRPAGSTRAEELQATAAAAEPGPAPVERPARRRSRRRPAASEAPEHVRASPMARRQAAELGVDLASVAGSGPAGAVVAADLAGPAAPSPPAPVPAPDDRGDRAAAMRRAIGDLMARSAREIPHYHLVTTINLRAATRWLEARNAERPVQERLLPAALLLKATARAARDVPGFNGRWDDGFQPSTAVHLGVAVSLRGGGLVAPAIADADRLDLDALMGALRDLVGRARAGRLRSSEMAGPTLTVTNLGDQGVDEVFGVIYAPQVALVGFGRVMDRPWAEDGMVGACPTVRATLAADHRVTDGHAGSRFLNAIDHLLQTPEDL